MFLRPGLLASLALAAPAAQAGAMTPVDWQACPADLVELAPTLAHRLRCARIDTALDHDVPGRGSLALDVMRIAAGDPAQRRGNLFINAGGPGVPGFQFAATVVSDWERPGQAAPDKARISRQHDVIVISPRGLDASHPLRCRSAQLLVPYADISDDRSPANIDAIEAHAAAVANACQAQPNAPYINTAQMAGDIEAVRQRLGDEPMNYWGVSWGTELGAWYGALFPQHVDRMILDSNVDWTGDLYRSWAAQGPERQAIFERFVVEKAIGAPDVYALGSTREEVAHRFLAMDSQGRGLVRAAPGSIKVFMAAAALSAFVKAQPDIDLQELQARALAHTYSPDPSVDADARKLAQVLAPSYFRPEEQPAPVDLDPGRSLFHVVSCQSSMAMPGPAFWQALGDRAARESPVGGAHNSYEPCAWWTGPTLARPDMRRLAQIPGLVMLQAEFDWHTPAAGAISAHAQIASASLVLARGIETHGFAYNGASACVDRTVAAFLADGIKPPRRLDCRDEGLALRSVPTYLERLRTLSPAAWSAPGTAPGRR